MKVLFVTDLHGSSLVLEKAIAASAEFDVDLLIVGGDVSGKRLLPVIPVGHGRYVALEPYKQKDDTGRGIEVPLAADVSEADLPEYLARLESKGMYWHIAENAEISKLNNVLKALEALFLAKISERLLKWADIVTNRLPEDIVCLWTGGNDDEDVLLTDLASSGKLGRFVYAEEQVVDVDDFEVASFGYSNETPFETSRELAERDLLSRLQVLGERAQTTEKLILNVHVPPENCGQLDLAGAKDSGTAIHVGSESVRTFIENVQPLADFAGHVHEGRGVAKIGRTLVFNPGSDYTTGILQGFLAVCSGSRIVDYVHITR